MHKIVLTVIFGLWLGALLPARADSFTLTDGATLSGDIVKSDENSLMLRAPGDVYTNIQWTLFSQDSLKQLAQNPKFAPLVEPFIEPTVAARPPKPEIKLQDEVKLELPTQTSVIGGLFSSSVGLFILFMIYLANLYAALQIAICRGRPVGLVVGVSAVLPFIAPIIFLSLPVQFASAQTEQAEATVESAAPAAAEAGSAPGKPAEESPITSASWMPSAEPVQAPKPQTLSFPRGKFTFNKRFIETKFSPFVTGAPADTVLVVVTLKDRFTAGRIAQVGANEMQIVVADGEMAVAFADIQEIQIQPKEA